MHPCGLVFKVSSQVQVRGKEGKGERERVGTRQVQITMPRCRFRAKNIQCHISISWSSANSEEISPTNGGDLTRLLHGLVPPMIARPADNSGALATVGNWVKSKGVSAILSLCLLRCTFPVVAIVGVPEVADGRVKFSSYLRPLRGINYCKLVAEPIIC